MALQANALVTLQQAKDRLGITDTSEDSYVENLINSISDDFESYCNREFKEEIITDYEVKGTDRQTIFLPKRPIQSIQKIEVNGVELDIKEDSEYDGYYIQNANAGLVGKQNGWSAYAYVNNALEFQKNTDMKLFTIKVNYTGGYNTIPANLQNAALSEIAREYEFQTGGYRTVANEKLQSVSQSFSSRDIDDITGFATKTVRTLNQYATRVII